MSRHRVPLAKTVVSGLEGYCSWSVIQGAAGLSLWPPNADRHVALRALVDAVPALANNTGPAINAMSWRSWLASRSSKKLRLLRRDGIHDEPLAVDGVLRGRRYDLLAGSLESPALQYRLLLDALCRCAAVDEDPALREALCLLETVARLSDRVVRIAGLARYRWPDHSLERSIGVPEDDDYFRLCQALTFIPGQVVEDPDRAACLASLVANDRDLRWKPLRRNMATGEWLVADPWRLTQAGLVRAYALVARSECRAELHRQLTTAALGVAVEAARDMDWIVEHVDDASVLVAADSDYRVLITVAALPPENWDLGEPEVEVPGVILDRFHETAAQARPQQAQLSLLALLFDGRCLTVPRGRDPLDDSEPTGLWILGLTDLRLLGDALRRDPLALPAALESIRPAPWPEGIDLVDVVGIAHRAEATPLDQQRIPEDGTEHMHWKARFMSARHCAPGPGGDRWVEVRRWAGSPDERCFTTAETDRFVLVVRMPGRSLWLMCADPAAGPDDLEGFICRVLALWVARMAERGFPELPEPVSVEVAVRIDIEFSELPGPAVMTRHTEHYATLVIGPGFVHALCRGDNVADRMLIAAMLDAVADRSVAQRQEFVDAIAPLGTATAGIWPYPSLRANPPSVETPPRVVRRDRLAVGRELASTRVPHDQIAVLQGQHAAPAVHDLAAELERLLAARVARLRPESLLELVELHEAAVVESTSEAMSLPARAAMTDADAYLGQREAIGERNVALRALIERAVACRPQGGRRLGIREAGWLRAAAELQVRLGAAYEFVRSGRAAARVLVSQDLGVEVGLHGELPEATERAVEQIEEAAPDLMFHEHHRWWTIEPEEPIEVAVDEPIELGDAVWRALDEAFLDEWSVRFEELLRLFRALSQIAEREPKYVAVSSVDELAARLGEMTGIDRANVDATIGLATLGPCDYAGMDSEHRPWRSNRERSYLRRPLVDLGDGRLAWSSNHLLAAARYLNTLVEAGRLRSNGTLAKAVMKVSQQLDRQFENAVLERVEDAGWQALLRVTEIAGVRLERAGPQQIGDIDVLAWHTGLKRVWLLDAKRLAPGLAADSMLRDAEKLEASADHQRERLEWVFAHRQQMSAEIGDDCAEWRIQSAIVINSPLAGAHLADVDLPVWTHRELPRRLGASELEQAQP